MGDETKISIELPSAAVGRFAEAAHLMGKDGVPEVNPDVLIGLVVALANPALVVRRTIAHYNLTIDEQYDQEIGFFGD